MKNLRCFNSNRIPLAISNMSRGSVNDVYDAVEDSETPEEFLQNLKQLRLFLKGLKIDRITKKYVRVTGTDPFGNVHYIEADFDGEMRGYNTSVAVNFEKMLWVRI